MASHLVRAGACALAIALTAATPAPAHACLWDHDTHKEEALTERDAAEVIGGQLGQRSREFYVARVTYTQPIVASGKAKKERYDDLAVALARTGDIKGALAVMDDKEARFPGEYTTAANRGTFLAMQGDLLGAAGELDRALTINPDAHFGREKYQLRLLQASADVKANRCGNVIGVPDDGEQAMWVMGGKKKARRAEAAAVQVPKDAVPAMVGLIRFGGAEANANVWYNLGLALLWKGNKQLGVRALTRAATLGHPCAVEVGGPPTMTVRAFIEHPAARAAKNKGQPERGFIGAGVVAEGEWQRGVQKDAARHAKERGLIAKRKWKQLFGY